MNNSRMYALLMTVSLAAFPGAGASDKRDECTVSVRNLQLSEGEVIVSFQIEIVAGSVRAASNIPVGWYFSLDNAPSWQTTVKANTMVGAASLNVQDFRKLQLVVEKNESEDLKFGVSGVVSVTKNYEKERHIDLKAADFALVPAH